MPKEQQLTFWQPTKFVQAHGIWRASRNKSEVSVASRLIVDLLAPLYADALAEHANGHLLDHGCGKLPLYEMYRHKVSSITAVDWEQSVHDTKFLDAACDLNGPLPFPDNSFDTIVSSDVIEHLWNSAFVMEEMARVLKHGGKLILGTPFNYWLHEEPYDYFRWSPHAIKMLGERSGFHVLSQRRVGGSNAVLVDTLFKVLQGKLGQSILTPLDWALRPLVSSQAKCQDQAMTLGTVSVLQASKNTNSATPLST